MNRSSLFAVALAVEARKTLASRVMHTTTALLVAGIALLASALTLAAAAGNEQILAQLGPLADADGWDRLIGVTTQIAAAASLLGYGVALSWSVGREFTDRTVGGLFALPVPRSAVAAAKLTVFLLWTVVVATVLVVVVAILGVATGAGRLDSVAIEALARLFTLTALTGLLAVPAAWAATLGRGLLPGIATTIGMVVLAQVAVVAEAGAWMPMVAPALWAVVPGAVTGVQLALVAVVPLTFGTLTLTAWHRLQLDR